MENSSGEESDFSDSEIAEYKDKPYEQLRNGTLKVKFPNGILRCPFCAGKKKQNFKYKDLHQHASGVGKGSSNRSSKQKANHLALALYLENELADEAEQPIKVAAPTPAAPSSEENDLYCWPWTGIVVNIVKELDSDKDVESTEYWMKRFSKYKPEGVEISWDDKKQTAQAMVRFDNDWIGFKNAMEFEKAFEADHHSKKEWTASDNPSGSSIYAWLARADDFESQGPIGDYLRTRRELKTISDLVREAVKTRNKAVVELASEIDMRNENLDDLQIKYNQKTMSLSRMLEEKDSLHQAFYEETRKMQRLAREHVKRVLDEQEMLNADLEKRRKKLDSWSKELNKREALTEREKQKLDEDKRKNDVQNTSLHMASLEQKKADESVLRLVEEQKREKEEALKKILELERQLDAKQKLKGKLQVMKHLGDEDDAAVHEKIKEMNYELQSKMDEMDDVENLNLNLMVRERQSNDELQEARKELIKNDVQNTSLHMASIEQKKSDESVLRLVEEQKRYYEAALTIRANIHIAIDILHRFNDHEVRLALFKDTCFGSWLDISYTAGDPSLVHLMLQTQILDRDVPEHEMWFRIGDQDIRFGREEFCIVTGLRFGPINRFSAMSGNPFRERVFPHVPRGHAVKVEHLRGIFSKEALDRLSDSDAVRVCLLMLLHVGFLGRQTFCVVSDYLLQLVEDLDAWNRYPWGSYVWDATLPVLKTALQSRNFHKDARKKPGSVKYTLLGFVFAFKMWIFEAFPIARHLAIRDPDVIPRALGWHRTQSLTWDDCLTFLDVVEVSRRPHTELIPTDAEQTTSWWMDSRLFFDSVTGESPRGRKRCRSRSPQRSPSSPSPPPSDAVAAPVSTTTTTPVATTSIPAAPVATTTATPTTTPTTTTADTDASTTTATHFEQRLAVLEARLQARLQDGLHDLETRLQACLQDGLRDLEARLLKSMQ